MLNDSRSSSSLADFSLVESMRRSSSTTLFTLVAISTVISSSRHSRLDNVVGELFGKKRRQKRFSFQAEKPRLQLAQAAPMVTS